MIACLFAGQGSQSPGMGRDLAEDNEAARLIYEKANRYLGKSLLDLTESDLRSTRDAQLAIVTMSLAAWEAYRARAGHKLEHVFAGFSLGEYSALAAAGVLQLEELLDLVKVRSSLMQKAAEKNPGAMYAIIGMKEDDLREILGQDPWQSQVFAANYNTPVQTVISGLADPAGKCAAHLLEKGAKRAVKLNVNGAFHTPFMEEAAAVLAEYAAKFDFRRPDGALYSNTLGDIVPGSINWPEHLARHMTSPVFWIGEFKAIASHDPDAWLEFGPGAVLAGMARKIVPGSRVLPVRDNNDLQQVIGDLSLSS